MSFKDYMRNVVGEYKGYKWDGIRWGPYRPAGYMCIPHDSYAITLINQYKIYCYVNDIIPTISIQEVFSSEESDERCVYVI